MSVGRKQNLIWDSFQEIKINGKIRLDVNCAAIFYRESLDDLLDELHNNTIHECKEMFKDKQFRWL